VYVVDTRDQRKKRKEKKKRRDAKLFSEIANNKK